MSCPECGKQMTSKIEKATYTRTINEITISIPDSKWQACSCGEVVLSGKLAQKIADAYWKAKDNA